MFYVWQRADGCRMRIVVSRRRRQTGCARRKNEKNLFFLLTSIKICSAMREDCTVECNKIKLSFTTPAGWIHVSSSLCPYQRHSQSISLGEIVWLTLGAAETKFSILLPPTTTMAVEGSGSFSMFTSSRRVSSLTRKSSHWRLWDKNFLLKRSKKAIKLRLPREDVIRRRGSSLQNITCVFGNFRAAFAQLRVFTFNF